MLEDTAHSAKDVPILLIVFNRPEITHRLIEALRELKPRKLFVAADGPRPSSPTDRDRCRSTREEIESIDWPCEVATLFRDENLGCKVGPESAISWFFSEVEEGIILEDDCLPAPDFFRFCNELLERYRDDDRVMMIGGYNQVGSWPTPHSYLFSTSTPTWGWATWRRAWRFYDGQLTGWERADVRRTVRARLGPTEYRISKRRFDLVRSGKLDAWDFAWMLAMLSRSGLSLIPATGLITNVGFGPDATHTKNPWSPEAATPTGSVRFPMTHPTSSVPDAAFEAAMHEGRFPLYRHIMILLPLPVAQAIRRVAHSFHRSISRTGADE